MASSAEVIVIGAGLAGLTTAHLLTQHGVEVLVLEAKGRVGGRLKNQTVGGAVVDAGGSWIGPSQRGVCALVDQLGMSTFPQYSDGEHLLLWNGRIRRFTGDTLPLGLRDLADLGQAMWRLDRAARRVGCAAPWSRPDAGRLDRQTVGAWLQRNTCTQGARFFLEVIVATSFGCRSDQLSLLAFLVHVASAEGLSNLVGVRGAALDRHIVGGAAALCDELARRLGSRVHLNTAVQTVDQSDGSVRIRTAATEFRARQAVLAVDPATASSIDHQPPLPARRHVLERTYAMGTGVKAHVSYREPFWRRDGLSGLSYSDSGGVPVTFDVSPPDGPGVLMTFTDAEGSPESRRAAVVGELAVRFGDWALQPTGYTEQDWALEPFQSGCVPRPAPGVLTAAQESFTRPVRRLHFTGAETSQVWEGHMDGAVRSAERVFDELMSPAG